MMDRATRRARIRECLGAFPEAVGPEPSIEATDDRGDHVRMRISYAVEPGERVGAWLLRPTGAAPRGGRPGAVACHQHAGQYEWGKSEPAGLVGDPMYHYGVELCRRGYVVICPDHLCFEDRRAPAALLASSPNLIGERYETFELTRRLLLGSCLQAKYLHDLVQAVDVLAARPEVDSGRLAAIGHSLGGQEALWLTWLDHRIRVGVSSCGFAPIRDILAAGISHNKAMYVPGLLQVCDVEQLVADVAPRGFALTAGEEDRIFPVAGLRRLVDRARSAYADAGVPDRFRATVFAGGHSFPVPLREDAYAFIDRCLEEG